jgi:Ser/Thr protein kinase RdoA (MazF antagonist)
MVLASRPPVVHRRERVVRGPGAGFDPAEALRTWEIAGAAISPSTSGLNNESWFVDAPSGQYVLRLYAVGPSAAVDAEHALLAQLPSAGLPFATPRPVAPAGSPTTWAWVATLGEPRIAALFERIPGEHLDDADAAGVEEAAAAFARLDVALATMRSDRPAFTGRIETVHPLVSDLDQLDELGPDGAAFVRRMRDASELRGSLQPRQIVHGDFAFGNVLLNSGRVSGILDFEVATEDARAAELGVALRLVLSKSTRRRLWRPLLRGYLRAAALSASEIDALPAIAAQHDGVVLAWWLGRLRSGVRDVRPLRQRVTEALERERWLTDHAPAIVAEAHRLSAASLLSSSPRS